jgi:hypothetical protein
VREKETEQERRGRRRTEERSGRRREWRGE